MTKWVWPLPGAEQVFPDEPGRYGAVRRFDTHSGVDIYCELSQPVVAVEAGVVIGIETFTGPNSRPRETPWWNETFAILVRGASGVVVYGEVQPYVQVGDVVGQSWLLGSVEKPVLKSFKGRPMVMLHLELLDSSATETVRWPSDLLADPTPQLRAAEESGVTFRLEDYKGLRFRDPSAESKDSRWWAVWGSERST